MQGKTLIPQVKWAQRKEKIFLTVELRDIKNEKVDLQPTQLKFSGDSDNHQYQFELNFFDEVKVEDSKWNIQGFAMQFILVKKNPDQPYWKRITKEEKKFQYIQVDWAKYIDEEDENQEGGKGLNDWDENKFQDFQGGQDGGDAGDEDDEDDGELQKGNLDDLEEEQQVGEQGHEHGPGCSHDHGEKVPEAEQ